MEYEQLLDKVDKLTLEGKVIEAKELMADNLSPLFYEEDVINEHKLNELVELNTLKL